MVHAGLTVSAAILNAVDELVDRAKITELWGMAPFAGNADDSIWRTVDMSTFLVSGQQGSALQVGIATPFVISEVARLAVGGETWQQRWVAAGLDECGTNPGDLGGDNKKVR